MKHLIQETDNTRYMKSYIKKYVRPRRIKKLAGKNSIFISRNNNLLNSINISDILLPLCTVAKYVSPNRQLAYIIRNTASFFIQNVTENTLSEIKFKDMRFPPYQTVESMGTEDETVWINKRNSLELITQDLIFVPLSALMPASIELNEQVLSYLLKNDKLPKAIILKQIYGDKTIVIDGLDELLISVFINHANFAFEPDQLSILANLE